MTSRTETWTELTDDAKIRLVADWLERVATDDAFSRARQTLIRIVAPAVTELEAGLAQARGDIEELRRANANRYDGDGQGRNRPTNLDDQNLDTDAGWSTLTWDEGSQPMVGERRKPVTDYKVTETRNASIAERAKAAVDAQKGTDTRRIP